MSNYIFEIVLVTIVIVLFVTEYRYRKYHYKMLTESNKYKNTYLKSEKKLKGIRIFYLLSCITLILIGIYFYEISNLLSYNSPLGSLIIGFYMIYHGVMGMVSKFVFIKLAISGRSPGQYLLHIIVIMIGLYEVVASINM